MNKKQIRKIKSIENKTITTVVNKVLAKEITNYMMEHEELRIDLDSGEMLAQKQFEICCRQRLASDIRKKVKTMISNNFGVKQNAFNIAEWSTEKQIDFLCLMYSIRYEEKQILQKKEQKFIWANREIFKQLRTMTLENDLYEYVVYLLCRVDNVIIDTGFLEQSYIVQKRFEVCRSEGDIQSINKLFRIYLECYFEVRRSLLEFILFFLVLIEFMGVFLINAGDYESIQLSLVVSCSGFTGKTKIICENIINIIILATERVIPEFDMLEMYLLSLYIDSTIMEAKIEERINGILLRSGKIEKNLDSLSQDARIVCRQIVLWMQEKNYLDDMPEYFDKEVEELIIKEIWQDKTKYRRLEENRIINNKKEKKRSGKRTKAAFEIAKSILSGEYERCGGLSEDIIFIREKIKKAGSIAKFGEQETIDSTKRRIKRLQIEQIVLRELGILLQDNLIWKEGNREG